MRHVVPRAVAALLVTFVLVACGAEAGVIVVPAWTHDPDDAVRGPAAWGGLQDSYEKCRSGNAQSPVDIDAVVTRDLPDLELSYAAAPLVVENTGRAIEVPMPKTGERTLTVGEDRYDLVQFHFHAPSEHTVDGRAYDAEVHLVHESEQGELAVVGVLLEETEDGRLPIVDSVVDNAPETPGEEVQVEHKENPLELLDVLDASTAIVSSYYTYSGSLTTPGCTEGVRWIVVENPVGISPAATDPLHELIAGFPFYDGYENNNRPTQPLNDREIVRDAG